MRSVFVLVLRMFFAMPSGMRRFLWANWKGCYWVCRTLRQLLRFSGRSGKAPKTPSERVRRFQSRNGLGSSGGCKRF